MRLLRHPLVLLVVLGLAAACGGGDGDATASSTGSSSGASSGGSADPETDGGGPAPAGSDDRPDDDQGAGPAGSGVAGDAPCPSSVPADLGLDPFYEQWCDVAGIPLVAAGVVDPSAMVRAHDAAEAMLMARPDIAAAIADAGVRIGLIGRDQQTTDMPEWADLNEAFPETDWDVRARGLGATPERPLVGAGEENLLCLAEDRYLGESIFVHELSHTIHEFGARVVDPTFEQRLVDAYFDASDAGLWAGTYAMENEAEYWAEGVQSFFDTNLSDDLQHNDIDSRTELEAYDPVLFALIVEIHGVPDWRPRCP